MHHAYLYTDRSQVPGLEDADNVDRIDREFDRLPIDAVRELIRQVHLEPVGAQGTRVVVIETNSINPEAQHAFLKLLEEPPLHTTIHLVVRDQSTLLPTVLSRLAVVTTSSTKRVHTDTVAVAFLGSQYDERLRTIADRTKAKDTQWVQDLLDGLERLLYDRQELTAVKDVLFVRQLISRPGASAKMLLEHVALSVPVLKMG